MCWEGGYHLLVFDPAWYPRSSSADTCLAYRCGCTMCSRSEGLASPYGSVNCGLKRTNLVDFLQESRIGARRHASYFSLAMPTRTASTTPRSSTDRSPGMFGIYQCTAHLRHALVLSRVCAFRRDIASVRPVQSSSLSTACFMSARNSLSNVSGRSTSSSCRIDVMGIRRVSWYVDITAYSGLHLGQKRVDGTACSVNQEGNLPRHATSVGQSVYYM